MTNVIIRTKKTPMCIFTKIINIAQVILIEHVEEIPFFYYFGAFFASIGLERKTE